MSDDDEIEKKKNLLKLFLAGSTLTKRELEIFVLLAQGKKNKVIAAEIHISYYTVKNHRASIYAKLSVKSKFDLWKIAQGLGLV
ncbi:MAG: helix-turn-helix transcriptional regulator [Bacteroidetes bacterium]|nr:helix-turn-helix transcriptional regulator [Bacteroidota bacterium]